MLSRGPKLKRLEDQTIVITGASSGIGLATARMAARARRARRAELAGTRPICSAS